MFKADREQAVTLGEIARLLADKDEVDQALKLHQEALVIYEEGLAILERSRDGFVRLGQPENAHYLKSIIHEIHSK